MSATGGKRTLGVPTFLPTSPKTGSVNKPATPFVRRKNGSGVSPLQSRFNFANVPIAPTLGKFVR